MWPNSAANHEMHTALVRCEGKQAVCAIYALGGEHFLGCVKIFIVPQQKLLQQRSLRCHSCCNVF